MEAWQGLTSYEVNYFINTIFLVLTKFSSRINYSKRLDDLKDKFNVLSPSTTARFLRCPYLVPWHGYKRNMDVSQLPLVCLFNPHH